MQLKVWILNHTWDDGGDITIFPSKAAAKNGIWEFVRDQWNDGPGCDGEHPMPLDHEEAVTEYFDMSGDYEWYNIYDQVVDFTDLPDLPNEEIILDSDECASVIALIDHSSSGALDGVSVEIGKSRGETNQLLNNVYQKLKD